MLIPQVGRWNATCGLAERSGPARDLLHGAYAARAFKWGRREKTDILERIRRDDSVAFHILALEVWGQIFELGEAQEALASGC